MISSKNSYGLWSCSDGYSNKFSKYAFINGIVEEWVIFGENHRLYGASIFSSGLNIKDWWVNNKRLNIPGCGFKK